MELNLGAQTFLSLLIKITKLPSRVRVTSIWICTCFTWFPTITTTRYYHVFYLSQPDRQKNSISSKDYISCETTYFQIFISHFICFFCELLIHNFCISLPQYLTVLFTSQIGIETFNKIYLYLLMADTICQFIVNMFNSIELTRQ